MRTREKKRIVDSFKAGSSISECFWNYGYAKNKDEIECVIRDELNKEQHTVIPFCFCEHNLPTYTYLQDENKYVKETV